MKRLTGLVLAASLGVTPMVMAEEGSIGVGYQFTWPASGISARYGLADEIDVQGVVGFFGIYNTYAARGLYRFDTEYPTYAYGTLGLFTAEDYVCRPFGTTTECGDETETTLGFGAGVGLEYQFEEIPVVWNIELGFHVIKFDELDEVYNYTGMTVGFGGTYYLDL